MKAGLFLLLCIYNLVVYYIPSFLSSIKNRGAILVTNPLLVIPVVTLFSFDESGDFTAFEILCEKYSGYYTQTESTFNAHCGCYGFKDIPHEMDFEGTSIADIFIYGVMTGCIYDECGEGVFFGFLLPFKTEVE